MIGLLKRSWIPLLLLAVLIVAAFTVDRLRGFFGAEGILVTPRVFSEDAESFDPKVVRYEIFGTGTYANINYLDLDAKPQRSDGAALPWSLTLDTTAPSAAPNIIAQGDGGSITPDGPGNVRPSGTAMRRSATAGVASPPACSSAISARPRPAARRRRTTSSCS